MSATDTLTAILIVFVGAFVVEPRNRAIQIRARKSFAASLTPERQPGVSTGCLADLGDRELDGASRDGVGDY